MTVRTSFFLGCMLAASLVRATTAHQAALEDLVGTARFVIVGKVMSSESVWAGARIVTRHVVAVEDAWLGEPGGAMLTVITPGGVVGTVGQLVEGSPELAIGERFVLFLVPDEAGALKTVALWQGVWSVAGTGSTAVASPLPTHVRLIGGPPLLPRPLDAFRFAVREVRRGG